MTSAKVVTPSAYPRLGCRREPTVEELLAMADGRRRDWRSQEPTPSALRDIEREMPAIDADIAGLVAELDDIRQDREMADRFEPTTARHWLTELDAEERAVRDALTRCSAPTDQTLRSAA